jgi:hypothetical protein
MEDHMGFKATDPCLAKAADDEPIFVLRAQDMLAPDLVRLWADYAARHGCDPAKVAEAYECATAMEHWRMRKYPD